LSDPLKKPYYLSPFFFISRESQSEAAAFSLLLEIPTEQSDVFEFCKKGIYIYSALLYLDFYDESVCELVRSKETRRR